MKCSNDSRFFRKCALFRGLRGKVADINSTIYDSNGMNWRLLVIMVVTTGLILSCGCTKQGEMTVIPEKKPENPVATEETSIPAATVTPGSLTKPSSASQQVGSSVNSEMEKKTIERASHMEDFISSSFPEVTELYTSIKKAKNALEWKTVQDLALDLQILIQDYKKTYQLTDPNPEKKVFPGLDSRQEIVFLKYINYLDDMENYATNLKNAVYYQEKGSDPQSAQTSRRYQGLADQFEKQAIATVKTISDYSQDFKYTFFDPKLSAQYRYTG